MSLVAVLIPVGPRHTVAVDVALRSLQAQRVPHTPILINDSDEPALGRPGTIELTTGGRKGVAAARNLGLAYAKDQGYPFITYLDADDVLMPHALEAMAQTYVASNAAYVYGDGFNVTADQATYWQARGYERRVFRSNNLHNVTALIPTALAAAIPWQEALWEDYRYFADFALRGWCGVRCAFPLIAYRLDKGERRKAGYAAGPDYAAALCRDYTIKLEDAMACCGGSPDLQRVTHQMLQALPEISQPDGTVRMLFTGTNAGYIPYKVGRNVYRGRAGGSVYADPADVERLTAFGVWEAAPPIPDAKEIPTLIAELEAGDVPVAVPNAHPAKATPPPAPQARKRRSS